MSKLWQQLLLVPTVVRLTSKAPRDPHTAWDRYWTGVRATGSDGDVLWDSDSAAEHAQYASVLLDAFDPALPVIDVGCGNGTHTRWLAGLFPQVLGIDVSPGAVARAAHEARNIPNADFLAVDATGEGAGEQLLDRLGPANVFVRGVFHVLDPAHQAALAANLRTLVAGQGQVFLAETNFPGSSLDYLTALGASHHHVPRQLERALQHLPRPGRFGGAERQRAFPASEWELRSEGPINIEVVPMKPEGLPQQVPGYFALLKGV